MRTLRVLEPWQCSETLCQGADSTLPSLTWESTRLGSNPEGTGDSLEFRIVFHRKLKGCRHRVCLLHSVMISPPHPHLLLSPKRLLSSGLELTGRDTGVCRHAVIRGMFKRRERVSMIRIREPSQVYFLKVQQRESQWLLLPRWAALRGHEVCLRSDEEGRTVCS